MKIMVVVGARPNFMKAAPVLRAIRSHNAARGQTLEAVLVHTGQHYDAQMSDAFFADLDIPRPDVFLGAGSGSHAAQTAEIMRRFEEVLLKEWPAVVIVVGDVNSTLACALVTSKMTSTAARPRPLVAHVEAGLRSFDRSMPEEVNRVLTDHISDLLFVTEESGVRNLHNEGIAQERIFVVGNTMIDSLVAFKDKAEHSTVLEGLGLRAIKDNKSHNGDRAVHPYALLTLHRPANVDTRETLLEILGGLDELMASHAIVFPAHPRTQKQIEQFGFGDYFTVAGPAQAAAPGRITMTGPQGYLDFLCLMKHATIVVTDSGGIQEETTCLGVPCVTVRENTERPVTIEQGSNVLAGTSAAGIRQAIRTQLSRTRRHTAPPMWDGRAAERIVEILARSLRPAEQPASVLAVR